MYWNNTMEIITENNEMAKRAEEIMKTRLSKGFECDRDYGFNVTSEMAEAMIVKENKVVASGGFYVPVDSMVVLVELYKELANKMEADFKVESCHVSDYDEGSVDAVFRAGVLEIESTYYPSGYCEMLVCEECGESVVVTEEYEKGKIYVCPHCGYENNLEDQYEEFVPEITKETYVVK